MKRTLTTYSLLLLAGCSSSSSSPGTGDDASATDGAGQDVTTTPETGNTDSPAETTPPADGSDASDAAHADAADAGGGDADAATSDGPTSDGSDGSSPEGSTEASTDGSCSAPAWLDPPTVAALALPDGGTILLHAFGSGTQDYSCIGTAIDGGIDAGDAGATFKWTLVTPDAVLSDCNGSPIGHHFASEAGASAPEWLTTNDGTYVIGAKRGSYTPDGGAGSIPWLLIRATGHGGSGTLSNVTYVQRLDTDGGLAPATGCDFTTGDASTNVGYTADYYFFGP
jgi:hypothetical protein